LLVGLALSWSSCAIGELRSSVGVYSQVRPINQVADHLGNMFFWEVKFGTRESALKILEEIEKLPIRDVMPKF
jgi:hypothetical protein